MSGHTLRDKVRNEDKRKSLGIANIKETTKENHLSLFGHMQRRVLAN